MNEIYWLTRVDGINMVAIIAVVLCCIVALVTTTAFFASIDSFCKEEHDKICGIIKKHFGKWLTMLSVSLTVLVFVPSKQDLLLIYGLGGTIDYVKSNDKAMQLPDKVVDALTRYVDNIEKEDTNN